MFKLAFYEYFADTRSYYKEHRWMLSVTLVLIVLTPFFMLSPQSYWLVYFGFIAITSDSEILQNYPKIFSYVPLDEKKIKHYILYRTFMSGLTMSAYLFLLACECTFIFHIGQNFWLPFWIASVLCKEKMTFYKTYKSLNLSSYYSGMTIFGKIFYWIIQMIDYITFAFIFLSYIPFNDITQTTRLDNSYIISASIIYQCLSLIYFVCYVRKSMKRLQLPELI